MSPTAASSFALWAGAQPWVAEGVRSCKEALEGSLPVRDKWELSGAAHSEHSLPAKG